MWLEILGFFFLTIAVVLRLNEKPLTARLGEWHYLLALTVTTLVGFFILAPTLLRWINTL